MEPIFTMQYAELAVADYLSKNIGKISMFIPASAQEKGIDLLMYRYIDRRNCITTVQVKMSRTYYDNKKKFPYHLWFNRFPIHDNADWYILVGIYPKFPRSANARVKSICWDTIMLAFTRDEMKIFMAAVKQKKDPTKDDRMFGFGFDDSKKIIQTRGCAIQREMTDYLIENRIEEIEKSFK